MNQDQLRDIIERERVLEILEDCKHFFDNRYTGKIEINYSDGIIAAVNLFIYKKRQKALNHYK